MTRIQKIVSHVMVFTSFFLSFTAAMILYSEQRLWHHLCLAAAILELAATAVYYFTVVKELKKNPPPLS